MRTLDATIAELTPGGEGVAICEVDGERRAVFVGGVASGERVRVQADLSRRPARGRLLAVLEPSEHRVVAECPDATRCGGCDWMHLAPAEQVRSHARIVESVLPRAFAGSEVIAHGAPRTRGYRTRARVHVEARRGRVVVGMYARGSRDPVAVDACIVLEPALDEARLALSHLLEGAKGRGDAQLALGAPGGGVRRAVFELRWSGDLPAAVFGRIERAVSAGSLGGARIFAGDVRRPATIGDPTPWITGADGAPLRLAPGGFSQASEESNALLARRVATLADTLAPSAPALELFAGAGNLTVLLARSHDVTAVELAREACEASRQNLAARGLSARVVETDAARFAIPKEARLVVLDPPRIGAKEVVRALAARPLAAVVYVSCDPPTLGRDLATLADGGYAPIAIETFEMFPQTSHVETLVALRAPERGRR